jgi:DNA-binding SARP family transcriptional activator
MSGDIALASAQVDPAVDNGLQSDIGVALRRAIDSASGGSVDEFIGEIRTLLRLQQERAHTHHAGISALNIAVAYRSKGNADEAEGFAEVAYDYLGGIAKTPEAAAAVLVSAWAAAHRGDLALAQQRIDDALRVRHELTRTEALIEAADIHTWFGSADQAVLYLDSARRLGTDSPAMQTTWAMAAGELALRRGEAAAAWRHLGRMNIDGVFASTGQRARALVVQARAAMALGRTDTTAHVMRALDQVQRQRTDIWGTYLQLAEACADRRATSAEAITRQAPAVASMLAEDMGLTLSELDVTDGSPLRTEIAARAKRWRPPLRVLVAGGGSSSHVAAMLLDEVGEADDVLLLRQFARRNRSAAGSKDLGRGLARRLAPRVHLEDLGRVTIVVGTRRIDGASVRRKVLSLLLFLASRNQMSATRDQVLEALWPDLEPRDAFNSLNQTLYFLRRLFEPRFREETSPGYVHFDAEVLWLDPELVTTQSQVCLSLLGQRRGSQPLPADVVDGLLDSYRGPFALDFQYDDWASDYRDHLHSAFLETVEQSVHAEATAGEFAHALELARRASDVDRTTEGLSQLMIRLSRAVGAHAAAAERYASYSAMLRREYGEDAPPEAELGDPWSADR